MALHKLLERNRLHVEGTRDLYGHKSRRVNHLGTKINRSHFNRLSRDAAALIVGVPWWHASVFSAYINGAAQQRASVQSFPDDPVQIPGSAFELVHLRHAAGEILKALCGASSGQSLIGAVQPDTEMQLHINMWFKYIYAE